jgi:integrase
LVKLGANLKDPETVKATIANQSQWKEAQKEAVVFAYDLYARYYQIAWIKPRYKAIRQLPFIPQEREIDDLIAGCNAEIALFLQFAKETGARAGEIYRLQWTDIDFEGHTVSLIAEKNSNPRVFRLSNKLYNMLCAVKKTDPRIFNRYKNLNNLRRTYQKHRKKLSKSLANPRLQFIMFHTLRHWKGSTEYHKTKDILHVMAILGHKNIKNTMLYTQLLTVEKEDSFVCKIAQTTQQATELIEQGFEYICDMESLKLFRKRK